MPKKAAVKKEVGKKKEVKKKIKVKEEINEQKVIEAVANQEYVKLATGVIEAERLGAPDVLNLINKNIPESKLTQFNQLVKKIKDKADVSHFDPAKFESDIDDIYKDFKSMRG